jgi:hypothetical protein
MGTSPSTFSRMKRALGTDADTFASILNWLGSGVERFTRNGRRVTDQVPALPAFSAYISRTGPLQPDEIRLLDSVMTAALGSLRQKDPLPAKIPGTRQKRAVRQAGRGRR